MFIEDLAGTVDQQVDAPVIRDRKQMQKFEKTHEMLVNCNASDAS